MNKYLENFVPFGLRVRLNQFTNKRRYDVKFGKGATAFSTYFEGKNFINARSSISNSKVGFGTYISGGCKLDRIKIGRFCSIGQNIQNKFSLHPSHDFVSTHPAFFSIKKQAGFTFVMEDKFQENRFIDNDHNFYTEIGNDVWIGNDVKIMQGIRIGDGVIIGAGAVVTKDLESYTIYGGIPAKFIRKRFTDEKISFLLYFKWWEKDFTWLEQNASLFDNIDSFMRKHSK